MEHFWCGVRDSADLPSPRPIHISINLGTTLPRLHRLMKMPQKPPLSAASFSRKKPSTDR